MISQELGIIYRCSENMMTNVSATLSSNQSVVGSGWCTSASKIVLDAMNIKMSPADYAVSSDPTSSHAAARWEWGPDVDSVDVRELSRGSETRLEHAGELEMLTKLCIPALKWWYGQVQTNVPHLQRYMAWISAQTEPAVEKLTATLNSLDNESILSSIGRLTVRLSATSVAPAAFAINRVYDNMSALLAGNTL